MAFNSADTAAFKNVWVFCEQRQGVMMPTTFELISEGRKLANELGVDLCGILLLDAGMGSGMTLDWAALAELRFPKPWFLSGGLGPENIGRALSLLSPDGLDLNSKLESAPGRKDAGLMSAAVRAAGRMPASA